MQLQPRRRVLFRHRFVQNMRPKSADVEKWNADISFICPYLVSIDTVALHSLICTLLRPLVVKLPSLISYFLFSEGQRKKALLFPHVDQGLTRHSAICNSHHTVD